ncbi:hypothetical protein PR202_ga27803 [Eleusine coracana subsp. coracana]|uniref:Nuclear nucleic acid-binding protein C1D n=1 Tax=Eleusine coracana subsp. coracana TaxID=191504 RepID=A0AAV5DHG1_ELECO|nr:hypothetical protein PR202_ga27803 [Eleusine coracana subsp. coracana]
MSGTAAEAASAVPPSVISAAEETLAAAESVGDNLSQLLAEAAEDTDAVAELPPLRRARAFLAMAHAATSLFAGNFTLPLSGCISISFVYLIISSNICFSGIFAVRLRCSGIDPDEHPIRKEFERLSLWQEKLNRYEDWDKAPLRPTTTLNTQAAARFIGHSLSHLTSDQKRSMQAISRGGKVFSGQKRKPEPLPERKSVRAAAEEFLAKAAQELMGNSDSRVKGPLRLIPDEDEE